MLQEMVNDEQIWDTIVDHVQECGHISLLWMHESAVCEHIEKWKSKGFFENCLQVF